MKEKLKRKWKKKIVEFIDANSIQIFEQRREEKRIEERREEKDKWQSFVFSLAHKHLFCCELAVAVATGTSCLRRLHSVRAHLIHYHTHTLSH